MQKDVTFWDNLAQRYAARSLDDPEGYQKTLGRTIAHLTLSDRVLELGCGTGSTALDIAPHVAEIIATDFAPTMLEIAAKRLAQSGLKNVTLQQADADTPSVAEAGPFDAILAFNLLHLVTDQDATLRTAHDMLKPGGLLVSKTACLKEAWYLGPMVRVLQWIGKAPHVLIHDIQALRDAHHRAGFDIVEELAQPGAAQRVFLVARKR